jgi:hypothetical protein
MPETVEAEEIHFLEGLLGGPSFESHAIDGGEDPGAIIAEAAVYKNFLSGVVAEKGEKLNNLFVGWRRPATDGDVNEVHTKRFNLLALPLNFLRILAAEINDGSDTQLFQLGKALLPGLRSAIQEVGDFPGVRDSRNLKFMAVRRFQSGRRRRRGSVLGGKREREKKEEGQER